MQASGATCFVEQAIADGLTFAKYYLTESRFLESPGIPFVTLGGLVGVAIPLCKERISLTVPIGCAIGTAFFSFLDEPYVRAAERFSFGLIASFVARIMLISLEAGNFENIQKRKRSSSFSFGEAN